MSARESVLELKARIGGDIIGQEQIVERLLIGLLSNGNLLGYGLPGLAKTRAVKSLARHVPGNHENICTEHMHESGRVDRCRHGLAGHTLLHPQNRFGVRSKPACPRLVLDERLSLERLSPLLQELKRSTG